jgi:hypothetical protein
MVKSVGYRQFSPFESYGRRQEGAQEGQNTLAPPPPGLWSPRAPHSPVARSYASERVVQALGWTPGNL